MWVVVVVNHGVWRTERITMLLHRYHADLRRNTPSFTPPLQAMVITLVPPLLPVAPLILFHPLQLEATSPFPYSLHPNPAHLPTHQTRPPPLPVCIQGASAHPARSQCCAVVPIPLVLVLVVVQGGWGLHVSKG